MIEPLFLVSILQIITASSVFFVWVVRYDNIIEEFVYYKLPTWLRDLVGILKVSFGIMLLMGIYDEKFKIIGAGGLLLLMIAALLTHVKVKNPIYKALPAVTLLSFSAIIIFSSLV
jgi:uncharacterized membrane protein YphA (DoxX/SURF4 family)